MEQIIFRQWRVSASVVDAAILRLEIEAADGSDIIEIGEPGAEREGEQYVLHLSSQGLEEAQNARRRPESGESGSEAGDDEAGGSWLADEDETLRLRGWEVNAVVDEDGLLAVNIERGLSAEIYEVEPLDIAGSQSSRIIVRLAAEESDEDEDEGEDEEQETDDADEFDQLDEPDDAYGEDQEDDFDDEDLYDDGEDLY